MHSIVIYIYIEYIQFFFRFLCLSFSHVCEYLHFDCAVFRDRSHCLWINWFNLNVVEHVYKCRNSYLWRKKVNSVYILVFLSHSLWCRRIYIFIHCYLFTLSSLVYLFCVRGMPAANICVNNSYFFPVRKHTKRTRARERNHFFVRFNIAAVVRFVFLATHCHICNPCIYI